MSVCMKLKLYKECIISMSICMKLKLYKECIISMSICMKLKLHKEYITILCMNVCSDYSRCLISW